MTVDKEARQGSIFRINIYREIWRKEEDRGLKRDPNNIGRNHTEGLSLSIKEKRKQRKRIGVRLAWVVFSWELEILLSSNPYPPPPLPRGKWGQTSRPTLIFGTGEESRGEERREE